MGPFLPLYQRGITLASMIFTGRSGTFTFEFDSNSSSGTFEPDKCSAPILKKHHVTTQPGHPYPSCSDPIDIPGGRDGGCSGKLKFQVSQFHPRCAAEQYDTDMALHHSHWLQIGNILPFTVTSFLYDVAGQITSDSQLVEFTIKCNIDQDMVAITRVNHCQNTTLAASAIITMYIINTLYTLCSQKKSLTLSTYQMIHN